MSTARVIRKYPNRRLYDTEDSRYITLSDISDLVLNHVEFVVIDKKSGHDITRCVLLQVINEREQQGSPVMTEAFLSQMIRSCQGGASPRLSDWLEQSLAMFMNKPEQKRAG
jgi:polyhydroxyalkanoate synthesis repressor PhaR